VHTHRRKKSARGHMQSTRAYLVTAVVSATTITTIPAHTAIAAFCTTLKLRPPSLAACTNAALLLLLSLLNLHTSSAPHCSTAHSAAPTCDHSIFVHCSSSCSLCTVRSTACHSCCYCCCYCCCCCCCCYSYRCRYHYCYRCYCCYYYCLSIRCSTSWARS
jgi:hypothetical protein